VPKYCGRSDDELSETEAEGQRVCPKVFRFHQQQHKSKCASNQHPQYAASGSDPQRSD
jgi:hypothetical protein